MYIYQFVHIHVVQTNIVKMNAEGTCIITGYLVYVYSLFFPDLACIKYIKCLLDIFLYLPRSKLRSTWQHAGQKKFFITFFFFCTGIFTKKIHKTKHLKINYCLWRYIGKGNKSLLTISKNFYTVVSNNFSFLKNVIKGYISNPMRKELIGDESVLPQTVVFPSV